MDACPTGALQFGEESELKDLVARAEILKPEAKAGVRVYYIGIPKRFIAGAVYDPEADECLQGATITLKDEQGAEVASLQTDHYGDFWFEELGVGIYSLDIEKAGYASQTIGDISTEKDINVGDIALQSPGG